MKRFSFRIETFYDSSLLSTESERERGGRERHSESVLWGGKEKIIQQVLNIYALYRNKTLGFLFHTFKINLEQTLLFDQ